VDNKKKRIVIKMKLSCDLVRHFFRFQNELKLYHWRTGSYARHRASDKLGQDFLSLTDRFIEAYMGTHDRVSIGNEGLVIRRFTDKNAPSLLREMMEFLTTLDKPLKNNPSLLNIRDEMVSALQQTLFLFELA